MFQEWINKYNEIINKGENMEEDIVKAKGNGQSCCYKCKAEGKWSLTWTSFLYRIKKDNYEHLYCSNCAKKIMKEG